MVAHPKKARNHLSKQRKTQLSTNERNYRKRGRHRLHYTRISKKFNSWVTRTKLLRLDPSRNEMLCCADTCCTNPFTQETTAPHHAFQNAAFQPREVTLGPFRIIWCLQSTQRQPELFGVAPSWAIRGSKFSCIYKTYPDTSEMWLEAWEEAFSKETSGSGSACLRNIP